MGFTRSIGRIGPLAVALGVGLAVASTPGVAYAEPSDVGSSSQSAGGASATTGPSGDGDGASSGGSDGTESSESGSAADGLSGSLVDADPVEAADLADLDDAADLDDLADTADAEVVDADADAEVVDAADGDDGVVDAEVVDADVDDADVVDADVVDADVVDADAEPVAAEGDAALAADPAVEASAPDAESASGDSATGVAAGGDAESASTESDPAAEADQAVAAAAAESSVEADGPAPLDVAAVADDPAPSSLAAPASALTTESAAAVSSPAKTVPTLQDAFAGVVRATAQVVVDVLDWVLAASGTTYEDSELPWGLVLVAGLRREIDQAFLAPYRVSQQATAQLAVAQSPNLLVNPGAEVGDASLSGNSAVSIPGWMVTGTPTAIPYGALRNSWPLGLSFPLPNLPSFMGYPKAHNGPPDGGAQMFGGGNVADSQLTQIVDLSAAAADIDTGEVTYNLSGWLGGWLANLSSASVKVDFLDANKTYLDTTSIGSVGVLERFFGTKLLERQTAGSVPTGTRYAQVDVILDQVNIFPLGINVDYNSAFADNISFTISADLPAPPPPTPLVSTVGELDHVFMVYMENKGYSDIVGSPDAPFLNSLINAYGSANNFFGLTHPSLPNYYPVIGGTDYGLTYECEAVCIFDHGTILTDNIDAAGMTWRGYAQSQPPGQPLENSGDYSVAQLPFVAFEGIGNDQAYAEQHLFPLDQMAIDLSSSETAPDYAWFAANESFNGEGPIDSLGDILQFAWSQITPGHQYNVPALDQFLSETVPVIMDSVVWNDPAEESVLVVTFDEDNDNLSLGFGDEGNRIVTVVIPSPAAVVGGMRGGHFTATDKYDHYSLMRMIEDSLGLPTLSNNDKFAVPMNEFWV
ncbi:MAG: alkaline phosphatase family protein [Mycobacterium sp.]